MTERLVAQTTSPTSGRPSAARSRCWTWSRGTGCPAWSPPRSPPPRSRSPSPARWSPTARSTCWTSNYSPSCPTASYPTTTMTGCRCCWPSPTPPHHMTARATAVFMAGARIAQHFGRPPGTPNDQAWVESFFGHLKAENPHLELIADPGELEAELTRLHGHYNTVRLHEGIGYVTPEDEHTGRGEAIRAARQTGLDAAHHARVAFHRQLRQDPS